MRKINFHKNNFQKWLFIAGAVAFALALLKNVFLEQHPGPKYYIVEFLAFLFFLGVLFISDKNNQNLRREMKRKDDAFEEERNKEILKIENLQEIIEGYEQEQNEASRFASYQDQVIGKLTSEKRVYDDKHHLLYLLSELFHGMAVILFQKEPSGQFNVKASYGLSEDFEPRSFQKGEGLHGQAVEEGRAAQIEEVPEDYVAVNTGLGESKNYFLYMLPVVKDNECTGLIELMTFRETEVERLWPVVMKKLVEKEIL